MKINKKKNKKNKSEEINRWENLLRTINRKKYIPDEKDNTYYVNESMPWNENMTNDILYKRTVKDINDIYIKLKNNYFIFYLYIKS